MWQFLFFNLVSVPNLLLYFPFFVSNLLLEFGFCAKFLWIKSNYNNFSIFLFWPLTKKFLLGDELLKMFFLLKKSLDKGLFKFQFQKSSLQNSIPKVNSLKTSIPRFERTKTVKVTKPKLALLLQIPHQRFKILK